MVRADDWSRQAERDILYTKESIKIEHFEWSVLAAQHGAEKAMKALFYEIGADLWGYSLLKFLKTLPNEFEIEEELIIAAKNLDKHYISSRYPNGFASGAPEDYYIKKDAEEAVKDAERIFKFCKSQISALRKRIS